MKNAKDLYNEISLKEAAIGDSLDNMPFDSLSEQDIPDLADALASIQKADEALSRAAARYSNWVPTDED